MLYSLFSMQFILSGESCHDPQKQSPVCLSAFSVRDEVINGSKEMNPECMS